MAFCSIRRMRVRDKLSPFARRETPEEFGQNKNRWMVKAPFYYISKARSLHDSISFIIKAKATTCHPNLKIDKRECVT